jgi:hypothetical protein
MGIPGFTGEASIGASFGFYIGRYPTSPSARAGVLPQLPVGRGGRCCCAGNCESCAANCACGCSGKIRICVCRRSGGAAFGGLGGFLE